MRFCTSVAPLALIAMMGALSGHAFAASKAQIGARISAPCAACHGHRGIAVDTTIPNLAGQHYPYLVNQLKAFRRRGRIYPQMNDKAHALTDEQIEDLSAYYSAIPIEVGRPPR